MFLWLSLINNVDKLHNITNLTRCPFFYKFQPETIPQAIIDMTKVLEVTTAEDVTSHPHSIAITAPERVTFVKGTCPEETKWWFNVLSAFPKSKVCIFWTIYFQSPIMICNPQGRHKRNATFPGGQATTILQSQREYLRLNSASTIFLERTSRGTEIH